MGFPFNEEILQIVRELVVKLTGFEEDSDIFRYTYKHVVNDLQNADSLAFVTQSEIEKKVSGLSDKFMIHGFIKPGQDLLVLYERFMGKGTPKDEVRNRLNVMKLLFCLSENPTSYLATLPEHLQSVTVTEEEEIDWKSYLWEGVERWSPPPDTDSDKWSDDEDEGMQTSCLENANLECTNISAMQMESKTCVSPPEDEFNYRDCLLKVKESVQNYWFNTDEIRMIPPSSHPEANLAIAWERHIETVTFGLLTIKKPNIISEYKVVREVIWQFWNCHNSVSFKFSGDKLIPSSDLTISSSRPVVFQKFLCEFLPYIEMLQEFRAFETEILGTNPADISSHAPNTYKSYISSVRNIIQPTMESLVDLEIDILKQDDTMTLLKLASICKELFKTVKVLKEIHDRVIIDSKTSNPLKCTTNLLVKLHDGLRYADTKMIQDIHLCLYLESLYTYMGIIDNWLTKGNFIDICEEFPIIDSRIVKLRDDGSSFSIQSEDLCEIHEDSDGWQLEYKLNNILCDVKDGLFNVISKRILQIGKNIHLLGMLGKLHLINDFDSQSETLYEEFVREVLLDISNRFGDQTPDDSSVKEEEMVIQPYKFPAICNDFCKFRTEMDKLENLVDTDDPFLMKAFESFFTEDTESETNCHKSEELLFSRISKLTSYIFPAYDLIETVFSKILRKRYGGCGRTVKNLLKYDYQLDDHLEFLRHLFLFKDGVISEFHKSLFMKIENQQQWGEDMSLTSHLQDIMIDIHPELYDKLTIIVDDSWDDFIDNPLKSSALFKINFKVKSPINIIIQPLHIRLYNELFFFIFRIKWGLYMLSRLQFKDIRCKNVNRTLNIIKMRLKILRFGLVNIFTLIQHYVMDHIYGKCLMEMEENYNDAHDLDTLIDSHDTFIKNIYKHAAYLRDFNENNHGVYTLLYLVRKLYFIWKNLNKFDIRELEKHEQSYKACYESLMPILSPSD